jgi:hypothetical protein
MSKFPQSKSSKPNCANKIPIPKPPQNTTMSTKKPSPTRPLKVITKNKTCNQRVPIAFGQSHHDSRQTHVNALHLKGAAPAKCWWAPKDSNATNFRWSLSRSRFGSAIGSWLLSIEAGDRSGPAGASGAIGIPFTPPIGTQKIPKYISPGEMEHAVLGTIAFNSRKHS